MGDDSGDGHAKLYLHPEDRMSKPIYSTNVKTHNIVLKIIVPKRTGRKRKRGSTDPYQFIGADSENLNPNSHTSASKVPHKIYQDPIRSLQDNDPNIDIQAVGLIERTHRFRSKCSVNYEAV